jgi:hypothetical protein
MLCFRSVSHHETNHDVSDNHVEIHRLDKTVCPLLGWVSGDGYQSAVVRRHDNPKIPPNLNQARAMICRSSPIDPPHESMLTGTINALVGASAFGTCSWVLAFSFVNPLSLAAGAILGTVSGIQQFRVLEAASRQDSLIHQIGFISNYFKLGPFIDQEKFIDEIYRIRPLCLEAGGVALTRYMDLEDALVAQGVVRR